MAKHDDINSDGMSVEELFTNWPANIKGSLDRRVKAGRFEDRVDYLRDAFGRARLRLRPDQKLSIATVSADALLPFNYDWNVAESEQNIQAEAVVLLKYQNVWSADWEPPRNLSLQMITAVLSSWARKELFLSDLDTAENGLLQAIRTQYMSVYKEQKVRRD